MDNLHRVGLERDFLATNKGMCYRRHTRYDTSYPAILFCDAQEIACTVLNISIGGAKVTFEEPVGDIAKVKLHVHHIGQFVGRIAWRNGMTLGIEFQDPLHDIERVVATMQVMRTDLG